MKHLTQLTLNSHLRPWPQLACLPAAALAKWITLKWMILK